MAGGPLLFLSHSGADTEPARELKHRLLASPEAKAANLAVWFDKDDLVPGKDWQEQLEDAVAARSTAFAVMVGTKGVVNSTGRRRASCRGRMTARCTYGTSLGWARATLSKPPADCRSKDVCILRRDFGIDVTERICAHDGGTDPPAPDFRELWIKYAASSSPCSHPVRLISTPARPKIVPCFS